MVKICKIPNNFYSKLLILFSLLLLFFFFLLFNKCNEVNIFTNTYLTDNCNIESIDNWIKTNNINVEPYTTDNGIDYIKILDEYPSNIDPLLSYFTLLLNNIKVLDSNFRSILIEDKINYLPNEVSLEVILPPELTISYKDINIKINDRDIVCSIKLNNKSETLISLKGDSNIQEAVDKIHNDFTNISLNDLNDPNSSSKYIYFPEEVNNDSTQIIDIGRDILKEIEFSNLVIDPKELDSDILLIGEMETNLNKPINVYYSILNNHYLFNVSEINLLVYYKLKSDNRSLELACTNCSLSPVSKEFSLKNTYTPHIVSTGLNGGGRLDPETLLHLKEMINDAKELDIDVTLISTFRSFDEQKNTFNYWLSRELQTGLNYNDAVIKTNTYSAKEGQSEHQLGTTLDIKCSTCSNFDYSKGNLMLYEFLKSNAHKYGFVISYPQSKTYLTGYKSEPWHIRYIGVELATKLYGLQYLDSNNEIYLTKYLVELNY